MSGLTGVPWRCLDDECPGVLGRIVRGELVVTRGSQVNTSETNLVVSCPVCGRPKVWYAKPRAVLAAASDVISDKVDKLFDVLSRVD